MGDQLLERIAEEIVVSHRGFEQVESVRQHAHIGCGGACLNRFAEIPSRELPDIGEDIRHRTLHVLARVQFVAFKDAAEGSEPALQTFRIVDLF